MAIIILANQMFNKYGFSFSLKQKQPLICEIRSQSSTISKENSKIDLGLNNYWRPIKHIENDYSINENGSIKDKVTGLMWQQSGSDTPMRYGDAISYIHKMNRDKFSGFDDWRIPTLPELISILEQNQNTQNLYTNPYFNSIQKWAWSSDKTFTDSRWLIDFFEGSVFWGEKKLVSYVRAVRCSP